MSTVPPTPPASVTTTQLISDLHSQLASLTSKHITLIGGMLASLVLLIVLMFGGGYFALRAYDAQLARQDAKDAQYQAALITFQTTMAQHDSARAAAEAKVSQLEAQIIKRNIAPPSPVVQAGLQPNATIGMAASALTAAYSTVSGFGQANTSVDGQSVSLSLPQAQTVISTKIAYDKAAADLIDEKGVISLQTGTISSLSSDLNECKITLTDANKQVAGYKKLAERTKLQKFFSGAFKVLIFAGGAVIGHLI
jgi:hypothetical protein